MTDSDANASSSLIQNEKSRTPLQFCKRLVIVNISKMVRAFVASILSVNRLYRSIGRICIAAVLSELGVDL